MYQVAMVVDDFLLWYGVLVNVILLLKYYFNAAPPMREEDLSPALGDAEATYKVIFVEKRGNDVQDFRYLKWILGRHALHGNLWWNVGGDMVLKTRTERDGEKKEQQISSLRMHVICLSSEPTGECCGQPNRILCRTLCIDKATPELA
jgi:hypothetical protein